MNDNDSITKDAAPLPRHSMSMCDESKDKLNALEHYFLFCESRFFSLFGNSQNIFCELNCDSQNSTHRLTVGKTRRE